MSPNQFTGHDQCLPQSRRVYPIYRVFFPTYICLIGIYLLRGGGYHVSLREKLLISINRFELMSIGNSPFFDGTFLSVIITQKFNKVLSYNKFVSLCLVGSQNFIQVDILLVSFTGQNYLIRTSFAMRSLVISPKMFKQIHVSNPLQCTTNIIHKLHSQNMTFYFFSAMHTNYLG